MLLRLLAARRGEALAAPEIADVLWPEDRPADPEAVLASLVSRLRRVLGADAVLGGREGYRLGAVETDVGRARRLLDDAGRAPPAAAAAGAEAALGVLGPGNGTAADPDDAWMVPVRAEVAALRGHARHLLARAALETGDPVHAEEAARAALAADGLDEEAGRELMRALLARNLPAEALREYDRLRRVLAEELGADPAPATRELHAVALRGEVPPAPAAPRRRDGFALAGRDPELRALQGVWTQACRHSAALVLLAGEAGIGKSRLLEELAGLARRSGGAVLAGRAFEGERSLFAQPLVDALASAARSLPAGRIRAAVAGAGPVGALVPGLAAFADGGPGAPAPTGRDPTQNLAVVTAFLRGLARDGPVLVAVDDLQRAGRSTVELLHYLARHLGPARVLLAAAARSGEGDEALDVLQAVGTTLRLGPLTPDAVAVLAGRAGHAGRAADVLRRTGGHPLFVVEVLRSLGNGEEGLPASVQTAVVDRVTRTGEATQRLLRAAAVLGASFDPLVAAAVAEVPEEAALRGFERALQAELLVTRGRQYEFAHDVVREALLASTPSPTLLAWHARAADQRTVDPEAVAGHAEAIGDRPRAARAWLLAAEGALGRFVASDAILLATRAVALGGELDDAELRGRALVARGRAHEAATHFAAALEDFTSARDAARRAGDRRLQMVVLRELAGDVPVALGRPPAGCEPVLAECLRIAGSLGDRRMEADVLDRLTVLRCSGLDYTGARELAARGLAAGRAAGDDRARARGLDAVKTSCAYLGLVRELEPVVEELAPLLRRAGDLWTMQWTLFEGSFVPLAAGDDTAALDGIESAIDVCRRSGYSAYEPFFLAHLGWVHRLAGRLADAEREGRRAIGLAGRHRHTWWSTTAVSLHAGTLLACGERAAAAALLGPAVRLAEVAGAEAYLLRILGPLADATGDVGVLHRADGLLRSVRVPDGCAWLLGADAYLGVARAWRRAGELERAEAVLAGFRAAALAAGWPVLAGTAV